jgi:hypothetical protein
MSILVRSRFQITYRWQTSFLESGEEIPSDHTGGWPDQCGDKNWCWV